MVCIERNGVKKVLPASWEEAGNLAFPCLRDLCKYPLGEGKIRAMARLAGMSRWQILGLSDENLATLSVGLEWLRLQPTDIPLQASFRVGLTTYHLPLAKFEDGTALEYAMADDYYQKYEEGDDEALRMLVATLARPMQDGHRIPLTDRDEVTARARALRRLSPWWLACVWMYWAGVKQYVYRTYGRWLFDQPDDEEGDEDSAPSMNNRINFGWWGVYMDIAESGVFGPLESVHQVNFHEIAVYLIRKEEARLATMSNRPNKAGYDH